MTSRLTLSDILGQFKIELRDMYPENEIRNMGYLVAEQLLNYSKIDFHLKDKEPISPEISGKIQTDPPRLKNWEPVQYIVGGTEFYGLPFRVDRRVLIPRPETEELADWIIRENTGKPVGILDIGTGSGCIAVTLAKNMPQARVTGLRYFGRSPGPGRCKCRNKQCARSVFFHGCAEREPAGARKDGCDRK